MSERTVAAISTPTGEGGISVIRISGEKAIEIADKVFVSASGKKLSSLKGYTALFGEVVDKDNKIDDAVALVFRAPKSYTGEDVVEISVHGGGYITKKALRSILSAGADNAAPGEFTKRAFLNGKLDLTQAESVMALISAQSESELKISSAAMGGRISATINEIKNDLVSVAACIAAYADYPEEELPELSVENFGNMLEAAENKLSSLISSYDAGRILREGIQTAIVGKPNVGKSTLMNLLSGCKKSIVTDIEGTTRDIIEDTVMLGEVMLRLADTAGLRDTTDIVEEAGVNLTKERMDTSELILAVFDSTREFDKNDRELLDFIKNKKAIAIINKSDTGSSLPPELFGDLPTVIISAKNGDGLSALERAVAEITKTAALNPNMTILSSERQLSLVKTARQAVSEALDSLKSGFAVDAVGVMIDDALYALYTLTGERATNTVTDEIFRKFCVGK